MLIGLACSFLLTFHIDTSWYRNNCASFGANSTISNLTEKTTLQGSDTLVIVDNQGTPTTKKITVTNATSSMKAYNDLQYSPLFSTSAGLASILSDEIGTSGGFVRGTGATLTNPSFDVAGTDATGDIYYNGGSGLLTRLAPGTNGEYLRLAAGLPDWDNTGLLTNPSTASSSFTATTSFAANNVNSNALIINSLPFSFQSTRSASGTVLTEDGSGNLRFYLPENRILYKSTASSTVTTTATSTAYTLAIPANTLGANGTLRITSFLVALAGSNVSKWQIQFGNGSASTTIVQTGSINPVQRKGSTIITHLYNHNSTGFQVVTSDVKIISSSNQSETVTNTSYATETAVDTTQKTYISFQAGENNAGAETGYGSILVELIRTP